MPRGKNTKQTKEAQTYNHGEEHPQRPDIGTEPQFKKNVPFEGGESKEIAVKDVLGTGNVPQVILDNIPFAV